MRPHLYESVQGWFTFQNLYTAEVAKAKDGAGFVEVGCWLGRSSVFMAEEIMADGKQIYLHCIDPFDGRGADYGLYPVVRDGKQYEKFLENIDPVKNFIVPHRQTSLEAAQEFHEESADFVFIDAGHDYESVKADLAAWWPKVKPGCHLAGHDYFYDKRRDGSANTGVARAVSEFVMEHKLDKLTLFLEQDCWLVEKAQ